MSASAEHWKKVAAPRILGELYEEFFPKPAPSPQP